TASTSHSPAPAASVSARCRSVESGSPPRTAATPPWAQRVAAWDSSALVSTPTRSAMSSAARTAADSPATPLPSTSRSSSWASSLVMERSRYEFVEGPEARYPEVVEVVLPSGRHQVGRQLGQGRQHEGALEHPRVRHFEVTFVHGDAVNPQQVGVEGARPPSHLAPAMGRALESAARPEELSRRAGRLQLDDHVEVRPLSAGAAA